MELIRLCLSLQDFTPFGSPLPSPLNKIISRGGGTTLKPFFYLAKGNDDLYICIRGASEPGDFAIVLDFEREDFLTGKAHHGVLESSRWIISECEKYINECKGRIICTGHSLGGATSAMIATILKLEKKLNNIIAISFAPFPIFTKEISNQTETFIWSFVYGNDLVPRLNSNVIASLVNMFVPPGPNQQNGIIMLQNILMQMLQGILRTNGITDNNSLYQLQQKLPNLVNILLKTARGLEKNEFFLPNNSIHFQKNQEGNLLYSKFIEQNNFNILLGLTGISDHGFFNYE